MAQKIDDKYDPEEEFAVAANRATYNKNKVTLNGPASAFGTELITKNKYSQYQWTVKSTFPSKSCQWIGICTDFSATNSTYSAKGYSVLWCNNCGIQGNIGGGHTTFCRPNPYENWLSGDCITVKVNFDNSTVEFWRNNNEKAFASQKLLQGAYKLAVYGYNQNVYEIVASSSRGGLALLPIAKKVLPMIKRSMGNLEMNQEKIGDLETTGLLRVKRDIEQFKIDYPMMMKQLSEYSGMIEQVDTKISRELNPVSSDYKEWNVKQVIRWVCSLDDGKYVKYQKKLEESMSKDGFQGRDLADIDRSELKDYGMHKFGDRKSLIESMRSLVNGVNEVEGNNSK